MMERIYHPYWLWEDFKHGFYDTPTKSNHDLFLNQSIKLLSNESICLEYMRKAINEWVYSCEHNLSNDSMNRIAYIGQAACCLFCGSPNVVTMEAWKLLSDDTRQKANSIALKVLKEWASKTRLQDMLKNGNPKAMKTGYQMKLQLSWKNGL